MPQIDGEAGVSSKCTLCFDRWTTTIVRGACSLPGRGPHCRRPGRSESEVSKYIAEKAQPYMPENGTTPSVYYV
ncbi:MAG: hypothetical protein ACLUE1_03565 [Adlercreutzia equolifaciens]